MPTKTRERLTAALDDLEASIPAMLDTCDECDLMEEFAGAAEMVGHDIHHEDREYFAARIDRMLQHNAMISGEETCM